MHDFIMSMQAKDINKKYSCYTEIIIPKYIQKIYDIMYNGNNLTDDAEMVFSGTR